MDAGRFRSDLFYRLNVVSFDIPPLRERIAVLPALARAQLGDHAAAMGRRIEGIAPAAMRALLGYTWPGNIRELRNVIERAVALGHGPMIELADLPEHLDPKATGAAMPPLLALAPTRARSSLEFSAAPAVNGPATDGVPRSPQWMRTAERSTLSESKDQTERALIAAALERNSHNRLRAAADLGISRMTLYKKLHKYGLMASM